MALVVSNAEEPSFNFRGVNRRGIGFATCEDSPGVCLSSSSSGPDCCNKQCVDIKSHPLHCGGCGMACAFAQGCCKGMCVNVLSDAENCGGCGVKCESGGACKFGMCSYA
ncbi:stigma-specific STIG1-like protein 3 [Canna indica]|uniref:Stigma-specific STIG1-like protein 3 n=1 Tax=Canna indica TaxID=4628 RepID=A0AAQ3KRH2_9LILI|nr:stigma-specific STIG1-like protein 3 [Canna indica]